MQVNESLNYTLTLKDLLINKLKKDEEAIDKLDKKMSGLQKTSDRLGNALAGAFSIYAIKNFGSAVIDSLTNYEYFSASLRTLLHGDTNAANLLNNQLVQLSKTSPFSLVDVQDSSKKLLAYGFAAKDIVSTMTMLGDVSSATGNQIGDVAYLYGTLRTQGVAMTKDLREFTNRGINLIPLLAKQFKIAEKDVYTFASESKISFKNVERAFREMTSEGGDFFNMMSEQSKTVGGKISNLGDAWEQLKITIGKSQTGILNSTVSWSTDMVNALNSFWTAEDKVSQSFKKYGARDYGFFEKFNRYLGYIVPGAGSDFLTGGMKSNTGMQEKLNMGLVGSSSKSLKDAYYSQMVISKEISNMYRDRMYMSPEDRLNGLVQFNRTIAILKGSLDEVKSNIAALKSPSFSSAIKKNGLGDLSGSSETKEISGSKPQNLYINIGKLVETLNFNTTNVKEGYQKIREGISQVLLESVNDANAVAR